MPALVLGGRGGDSSKSSNRPDALWLHRKFSGTDMRGGTQPAGPGPGRSIMGGRQADSCRAGPFFGGPPRRPSDGPLTNPPGPVWVKFRVKMPTSQVWVVGGDFWPARGRTGAWPAGTAPDEGWCQGDLAPTDRTANTRTSPRPDRPDGRHARPDGRRAVLQSGPGPSVYGCRRTSRPVVDRTVDAPDRTGDARVPVGRRALSYQPLDYPDA